MTRYRMIGRPYGVEHASKVEGYVVGEEFDADFSEADERSLVGAGAVERVDGESLQPEATANGMDSMDVPPHTAEPGVGYQEVENVDVTGERPATAVADAPAELMAEEHPAE